MQCMMEFLKASTPPPPPPSCPSQHLLSEMESLKPKVQAVQLCQSALRIPEDVVASLPLCHAALRLQEEASQLQHTAIQQYNIMQAGAARCAESSASRAQAGRASAHESWAAFLSIVWAQPSKHPGC